MRLRGVMSGVRTMFGDDSVYAQCFPLYSVLLAVGRTNVDFLRLDVDGYEFEVLRTIPWHKVNIRVRKNRNTHRFVPFLTV